MKNSRQGFLSQEALAVFILIPFNQLKLISESIFLRNLFESVKE